MSTESPLKVWLERDGALLRLRLARPKANIVDAAMIVALHARADRAAQDEHAARRAARCRRPALQLRRQRRGAPARQLRADARLAARAAAGAAGVSGTGAGRGARPVPGRRPGTGAGRRTDLRRADGAIRAARDQAGRVRAGRLGAAALSRDPTGRRGPAASAAARSAAPRRSPCGLVQALAEDPEAAALAWFEQHLQDKSAAALACALAAARGQMLRDVRRAARPKSSSCTWIA